MVIASSRIGMESARTYISVSRSCYHAGGSIFAFPGISDEGTKSGSEQEVLGSEESEETAVADNAKNDFDNIFNRMKAFATSDMFENKMRLDAMNRIRVECIQFLLYMLFGAKSHADDAVSLAGQTDGGQVVSAVSESYQYYHSETEDTSFTTAGCVKTADGREISFNLELSMSRSFTQYYERNVTKLTNFTDPLVINLDSPIADVSDVRIRFDLDCDGKEEEISALSSSCGYLALDQNGDGIINDGSELFGTSSQDGFADLAAYDLDGNGWIDEADEVFDRLVIAILKEDGSQELVRLKDRNIGALYTGSASTDFSLNDLSSNDPRAQIRRSGVFLYEDGMAGTMQHLDMRTWSS